MDAEIKFVEQRRSQRRIAFIRASIIHPLQTEHMNCTLHDISEDGALLDFAQAMDLPTSFWLRLEGEQVLRLCTVAWRSSYELGVAFSRRIIERRRAERLVNTHADWTMFGEERRRSSLHINTPLPIR